MSARKSTRKSAQTATAAPPRFLHDDPDFEALVRLREPEVRLAPEFLEKDYWVTHVLWWLGAQGFTYCFKGGTSLSKCFGLISRFSEDIDLWLVPPSGLGLPAVGSWDPRDEKHAAERLEYFRALREVLTKIPGITSVRYEESRHGPRHVNAVYFAHYTPLFPAADELLQPAVQIELAPDAIHARVDRPARAFVHEGVPPEMWASHLDTRPAQVPCVHPIATLLGKLDAICNQHRREVEPSKYIRHFEDAHHIITGLDRLPPLPAGLSIRSLGALMRGDRQIRRSYDEHDPAFELEGATDHAMLERAHAALGRWYWGPRVPLLTACATIRTWLASEQPFADVPTG